MEKTKLIGVLKTFNNEEIKSFSDFVSSPYFNKEKVLIRLTEYLQKYHPAYKSSEIEKEKVFAHLYPGKKYNDGLMRNIISDILAAAQKFLAVNHLEKNSLIQNDLMLGELSLRKLNVQFEKVFKKAGKTLEDITEKDERYYYYRYLLEDKKRRWMQSQPAEIISSEDNIQTLEDNFLIYFLVDQLKTLSIMVNQKKYIYDHTFKLEFWEEIDSYLIKNPEIVKRIPYIDMFYTSLKLFLTEDEKYFHKLRLLVKNHYNILNEVDKKNIYVVLVNYCAEKINKGTLNYIHEKFELYKEIVETGAHYEGKLVMSHIFYKGVVGNALQVSEFRWTEEFINKYKNELDEEFRDSTYYYCLAQLNYTKKEFNAAMEFLSKVSLLDVSFKLEVNVLQLMIYYDTNSDEPFYSLIDSFSHMLSKNRFVSERKKKLNGNFTNFIKELYRIKSNNAGNRDLDVNDIKKRIEDNDYLIGKTWLLKKADETEKAKLI